MFKLTTIVLSLFLSAWAIFANPTPAIESRGGKDCITDKEAKELLSKYSSLFQQVDDKVVKKVLTKDYTVYSESLQFLLGPPGSAGLGKPFSTGRDVFVELLKQYEATLPAGQENIILDSIHSCDKLFYRYKHTYPPNATLNEFGFDALYLTRREGPWKVYADYTESNNVVQLIEMGKYPCNATNSG